MRPPVFRGSFLAADELVVDSFAGGGGASTGQEQGLGRSPDIAINHSAAAEAVAFPAELIARFWVKVDKNGTAPAHRPELGPCWLWTGNRAKRPDGGEASLPRADKVNGFGLSPRGDRERVWCLTNEIGTLVTRRNGRVAIVGNCLGRVYRDGQPDPVMAYYLVADSGSDPVVADVLGLKKAQSDAVRDPSAALIQASQSDPARVKRLAEDFLRQRGQRIPVAAAPPAAPATQQMNITGAA